MTDTQGSGLESDTEPARLNDPGRGQATLRAFFLEPLVAQIRRSLPDATPLLGRFGLADSRRLRPYDMVPLASYIGLFENAAETLGNPALGLELGKAFRISSIGPVYPLMAQAQSLRIALAAFAKFQLAWQSRTTLSAEAIHGATRFTYLIEDLRIWPRGQDAEFTLAAMVSIIRQLTHDRWTPIEVRFEHNISRNRRILTQYFGCLVEGNAAANRLIISNEDMERPLKPHHEIGRTTPAEAHLLDLFRADDPRIHSTREQVAQLISRRIGWNDISLVSIAAELGVCSRTLRRHLDAEGTTFSQVVADERLARARILLVTTRLMHDAIAQRLGLASAAVFSRAFSQWSGQSPSEYRKSRSHR